MKPLFFLCSILLFVVGASAQIESRKTLFVSDLSVVNSVEATSGPLSFGSVFARIFPMKQEAQFAIKNWMDHFATNQVLNGYTAQAKPRFENEFGRFWKKDNWQLPQLEGAPFILNAVVNRVDLASHVLNRQAGELRFVYQAVSHAGETMPFMIILEFKYPYLPEMGIDDRYWARRWLSLNAFNFGPDYNAKLVELINEIFSLARARDLFVAFRSAEGAFGDVPQTRSFAFNEAGQLALAVNSQTPDHIFRESSARGGKSEELIDWIKSNVKDLIAETAILPQRFLSIQNNHFVNHDPSWAPELIDSADLELRQARKKFAMTTCTGCHSLYETNSIVMVGDRRNKASESQPSEFLRQQLPLRLENLKNLLDGRSIRMTKNIRNDH